MNKNIINKVSTLGIVTSIAVLVSLSGIFGVSAATIGSGYGYGSAPDFLLPDNDTNVSVTGTPKIKTGNDDNTSSQDSSDDTTPTDSNSETPVDTDTNEPTDSQEPTTGNTETPSNNNTVEAPADFEPVAPMHITGEHTTSDINNYPNLLPQTGA